MKLGRVLEHESMDNEDSLNGSSTMELIYS
jgi:hypothetical protein